MRLWKRTLLLAAPATAVAVGIAALNGDGHADDAGEEELFPMEEHYLLPPPLPLLSDP